MLNKFLLPILILTIVNFVQAQDLVYIWGGPGDNNSEFNGGLNDWTAPAGTADGTADPDAVWAWTADGSGSNGLYWGSDVDPIGSPTATNGAAILNSDFLATNGVAEGSGLAAAPQTASLMSPSFSCTGRNSVFVRFHQYFRSFFASSYLDVSIDGGGTWQTADTLNTTVLLNQSTSRNSVKIVDITSIAANQPNVQIRFRWDGDFYYWIIDDVSVIEQPKYDISMGSYFMPFNLATPASQITTDTSAFSVVMTNRGSMDLTDIKVKVRVFNLDTDETEFMDSTSVLSFPAQASDVIILPNPYAPDNISPGFYGFEITAELADGMVDANTSDNRKFQDFLVSNSLFSKDLLAPGGFNGIGYAREGEDYTIGNQFFTSDTWTKNTNFMATEVEFITANFDDNFSIAGLGTVVYLVEVDASVDEVFSNFDINDQLDAQNPQLKYVGTAIVNFTEDDDNEFKTAELVDFQTFDPGVALKPGTRYFLVAVYNDNNNVLSHALQTEGNEINYYTFSTVLWDGNRWYGGIIDNLGNDYSAVMRMTVQMTTLTDDIPLPEHTVKIFPNPTADILKVEMDFDTPSKGIVVLTDITGKVIEIRDFRNITRQQESFDLQKLANGTYLVRVSTAEGSKTNRVLLQR